MQDGSLCPQAQRIPLSELQHMLAALGDSKARDMVDKATRELRISSHELENLPGRCWTTSPPSPDSSVSPPASPKPAPSPTATAGPHHDRRWSFYRPRPGRPVPNRPPTPSNCDPLS